jgi:hypothetical protein
VRSVDQRQVHRRGGGIGRIGAAFVAVSAMLAMACDEGITSGVVVENRTTEELKFSVLLESTSTWYEPVAQAPPNSAYLILPAAILPKGGCTAGGMIAMTQAGDEVARRDEPLCVGDRWVIEVAAAGPSPSARPSAEDP